MILDYEEDDIVPVVIVVFRTGAHRTQFEFWPDNESHQFTPNHFAGAWR
jgi:hypothetical protein